MKGLARLGLAAAFAVLAALAVSASAHAFSTPGGMGTVSLDSMGAPPSAVWRISASPPVYQVNETLIISFGDTLSIAAGTRINFVNTTELIVLGGLIVAGNASAPVEMAVVPDAMSMAVAWGGIRGSGPARFVLEDAVLSDTIDISYSNASGAILTNLTYQGRLLFDNASLVAASGLVMTITPTDVGRIALWLENSDNISVAGADLQGGTGWGGAAVIIENSHDIAIADLTVRDDNANLMGVQVILSQRVRIDGYTFTQGPLGGDPNQALDFRDSTDILVDRLVMTHIGLSGLGAIYGIRSNVTISNSTFDGLLNRGVWQYPGTLTGVNATNVPVDPSAGGTVADYELVRVRVQWAAGGAVASGNAFIDNASWSASGAYLGGLSDWLWALREVNVSGAVNRSTAYRADVTCNCTGGSAFFNLSDAWGVTIAVFVGDPAAPVPVASAPASASTGTAFELNATASFDNAAIAAYLWTLVGGGSVNGLPCGDAVCLVTLDEPGSFTFQLNVTDTAGRPATARTTVTVADVTPPVVTITNISVARPGQNESFAVTAHTTDNDPAYLPQVQWFVDGARVPGDTLAVTLRIATMGAHAVRVTVEDDGGNSATAEVVVVIRDALVPVVGVWTAPAGLTAPATVQLDGSIASDNVAVTAWHWRVVGPGGDYQLTGVAPNATFVAPGTYNVTLTAEDAEGNRASRTFEVTVSGTGPGASDLPLLLLVGMGAAAAVLVAAFVLRRPKAPGEEAPEEKGED